MSATGLDYPIALRLAGKAVLVVGAGKIAEGRVGQLLEAGAHVHVVAPEVGPLLRARASDGALRLSERPYCPGDCAGAFIVFTASNDADVNRAVVDEARSLGILVNAADMPALCDFYVPSMGRQGPIVVAVSTSGNAPALARVLREHALAAIGPEYGQLARIIGKLRRVMTPGPPRTRLFERLVRSDAVLESLRAGQRRPVFQLLRAFLAGDPLLRAEPRSTTVHGTPFTSSVAPQAQSREVPVAPRRKDSNRGPLSLSASTLGEER